MCIIIHAPAGTDIDPELLKRSMGVNGDGWGLAVRQPDGSELNIYRGFGERAAIRRWTGNKDADRVFHARDASPGTPINHDNLHPFSARAPSGEERWLFHNGRVRSFPTIHSLYCDSWHVAQYLSLFNTTKRFHEGVTELALKETSRFALVRKRGVDLYGTGWLQSEGVWFSNPGAFATKVTKYVGGAAYEGIAAYPAEITCNTHHNGLVFDDERKIYSNKAVRLHLTPASTSNEESIAACTTIGDKAWGIDYVDVPGPSGCKRTRCAFAPKSGTFAKINCVSFYSPFRTWICTAPLIYLDDPAFMAYLIRRKEGVPHDPAVLSCKAAGLEVPAVPYFRPQGVFSTQPQVTKAGSPPDEKTQTLAAFLSDDEMELANKAQKRLDAIRAGEKLPKFLKHVGADGTVTMVTLPQFRDKILALRELFHAQGKDDDATEELVDEEYTRFLLANPELTPESASVYDEDYC